MTNNLTKKAVKMFVNKDFLSSKRLNRLISKGWKVVDIQDFHCTCGSCDPAKKVVLQKKNQTITLQF